MCTDVLAAVETTAAAICMQSKLTLHVSGGDKIVVLYPWGVFETPACSKQEWHDGNKLEDFYPKLSFSVTEIVCFNWVALTCLPEAAFILQGSQKDRLGMREHRGIKRLAKVCVGKLVTGREAESSDACSSLSP